MSNAGIGKPPSRPYQSKYHHEMAVADNRAEELDTLCHVNGRLTGPHNIGPGCTWHYFSSDYSSETT